MSDDEGWAQIAGEYSEARRRESEAKAEADALRDQLIERAKATGCKNAKGYGWQVIRSERAGSVAYAKAITDIAPDADLSAYTGKPDTQLGRASCRESRCR